MGTGPVGVRGRFGKGETSLQKRQGSGSGARSTWLHLAKVSFRFTFGLTSNGGMDIDKFFITVSILFCGWKLVNKGKDLLSCFPSVTILREGFTETVKVEFFFSTSEEIQTCASD
jgi:hypothetical protein